MKKVILLVVMMLVPSLALAVDPAGKYALIGGVLFHNSAYNTVHTIEYNHRFDTYALCNTAKTAITAQNLADGGSAFVNKASEHDMVFLSCVQVTTQ